MYCTYTCTVYIDLDVRICLDIMYVHTYKCMYVFYSFGVKSCHNTLPILTLSWVVDSRDDHYDSDEYGGCPHSCDLFTPCMSSYDLVRKSLSLLVDF